MERDITKKSCLSDNERYADLIKRVAMDVGFVVIGIENQDEVHYMMPLRSMAYDVAEYERQAAVIRKQVRKRKGITRVEFLSGFARDSRLMPCITLVLYYGNDWDGSRDLHGILDMQDIPEEMRAYINNYFIHLIEIRKLENTEVFRTDLKQIFDFIRYSEDKKKLQELVLTDPAYREMDEDAYDMAATYANAEELIAVKKYHGKDGKVNMCKAIKEWMEDERQEGRQEGAALQTISLVRKKSNKGMGVEEIAELLEEDEQLIRNILEVISSKPKADDEEVCTSICTRANDER